jgi:hypothetical protein
MPDRTLLQLDRINRFIFSSSCLPSTCLPVRLGKTAWHCPLRPAQLGGGLPTDTLIKAPEQSAPNTWHSSKGGHRCTPCILSIGKDKLYLSHHQASRVLEPCPIQASHCSCAGECFAVLPCPTMRRRSGGNRPR